MKRRTRALRDDTAQPANPFVASPNTPAMETPAACTFASVFEVGELVADTGSNAVSG